MAKREQMNEIILSHLINKINKLETELENDRKPAPAHYTVAETAHILGCSERTVRRMIKDQRLHTLRVGGRGRVYIPAAELEPFLPAEVSSFS